MDTFKLFHGLTEAMYESLGQALIIYLLARLIIFLLPWMDSVFRYRVLYFSLTLSFFIFAGRLFLLCSETYYQGGHQLTAGVHKQMDQIFNLKHLVHEHAFAIGIVYFLGLIVQLTVFLTSFLKVQWYRNRRYLHQNEFWQLKMEAIMKGLGIKRKVSLFFGDRIRGPFTIGWIRPAIFFPVAALANLSTEQVEAILLHELAHIRRNDYLWNLLQRIMEMFLFFNPVTWVIAAEIKREREYCCDDVVLQRSQSTVSYAKALFLLEKERSGYNLLMQASGEKRNTLLERIKRLTDMETTKSTGLPRAVVFTGIMAAALFLGWVKPSEKPKENLPDVRKSIIKREPLSSPSTCRLNTPKIRLKYCAADTTSPQSPVVSAEPVAPVEAVSPVAPMAPVSAVKPVAPIPPVPPAEVDSDTANSISRYFKSPEWKKQMENVRKQSEEIKNYFNSPEWKQQMEGIKKQTQDIKKYFDSPEWKHQMAAVKKQSAEFQKHFNSPEWKQQIAKIKSESEAMKKFQESPEFKQQIEAMKKQAQELSKQFNSAEWKQQMQELKDKSRENQRKSEEMKKKDEEMKKRDEEQKKMDEGSL